MRVRHRAALLLSASTILGMYAPVHAQATEPAEAGALADQEMEASRAFDGADPTSANSKSSAMEMIVVTATRRAESLQNVSLSVTALDSSTLETAGIDDIRSLTYAVPGYTGGRAAMAMQPNIRGVGSIGVGVGDESNIATYIDGIYIAGPYNTQVELVEIERVEVLRGPQGAVFGRNATGGLINVITPDPSFTFRGNVSASLGVMREDAVSFDFRSYLTGPISDNIAADFAVLYRDDGDYVTDLVNGGTFDGQRTISARSKVLITPSSSVRLIFTAGYMDIEGEIPNQPFMSQAVSRDTPGAIIATEPWTAALDLVPTSTVNRLDISMRAEIDLGSVTLESTTAYSNSTTYQLADSDATNIFVANSEIGNSQQSEYNQEIRLLSNSSSPFEWTAGLYFFGLDGTMPFFISSNRGGGAVFTRTTDPDVATRSYAAFAQGTYEIADSLFFTLGGRYTRESRSFSQSVNGVDLFGESEVDFDKFTYNTALRYNFIDDSNVYISFGTGFKSGVFNAVSLSPDPVDPETISALEGGVKVDLTPWLRTNFSVYHYWYDDLQVQARAADNSFVLQNAAKARIYGGEFELLMEPTDGLSLRGAFAYTHGEYRDFPGAQSFSPLPSGGNSVFSADASGFSLVKTPRYTINLGANYNVDVGDGELVFGINLFHSDRVYYDFINEYSQEPYTLISAEMTWSPDASGFRLGMFVRNLTNEAIAQQVRVGSTGSYAYQERPREIGIRGRFEF